MKKQGKGFFAGVLCTLLVMSFVASAYAAYQKQATLNYNDIKITLDGKAVTPKDATGKAVEPFTIDGTTYLPVRAVADAVGLNVEWDQAAQTVKLSSQGSKPETTPPPEIDKPVTTNKLLVDKNGVKITYTGISSAGNEIQLLIENSSSKTYMIQTRDLSINGYMIDGIMSENVAPGKKANTSIKVLQSYLTKNNITKIETVELRFSIINAEDWGDSSESDVVKIAV